RPTPHRPQEPSTDRGRPVARVSPRGGTPMRVLCSAAAAFLLLTALTRGAEGPEGAAKDKLVGVWEFVTVDDERKNDEFRRKWTPRAVGSAREQTRRLSAFPALRMPRRRVITATGDTGRSPRRLQGFDAVTAAEGPEVVGRHSVACGTLVALLPRQDRH